jgi:hypothetical protein
VVSILSISEGAQQQLEERLNSLGADVLTVSLELLKRMVQVLEEEWEEIECLLNLAQQV